MTEEKRNGQKFMTSRDLEEMIQGKIANDSMDFLKNPMEYWSLLAEIKQARALEHIANMLRDGKLKIVTE